MSSTSEDRVYVNAIGLPIELDVGRDLSDAGTLKIQFRRPSGTTGEWVGEQFESTMIRYVTADGDLNLDGEWKFRSYAFGRQGRWLAYRIYAEWE